MIFSIGNMIVWGVAAIICAYVAREKGQNSSLALILGIIFGFFSMIYYLFSKPANNKWKIKNSWYILGGYILLILVISAIETFLEFN
jgi:H+/Cl- antiporter ClcA